MKQARSLNMDHHQQMQSSAATEAKTFPQPNPRCRLCLQWADHGLQSIFTEEDDSLPLKIRDCLGLIVSPEDSIQTVCTNCRQTVGLIDEFRTMCRQTEEIYESVQIRCENREKRERYREYVGELRKLIQEHKDRINEQLVGVQEGVEGTAESEEDYDDEPMAIELLEIKAEPLPIDESDEATDDNKEAKPSKGSDSDIYEQQVKIAQEVLKRLKLFTSNAVSPKQLWTEIAEKLGMEYSAIRTRWNRMKRRYLDNKAGAATGSQLMILRLEGCRLFNLMNQILPELDESVEPWVAPESFDTTEKPSSCKKLRIDIDLKIAIAEEIRSYPEIWDRSLVSSTVTMDQAWKTIARNFNMDDEYIRLHWRSLQDLYRRHKKREAEGAGVRTKADTKFYTLIEIMQDIYSVNEREIVKKEQMEEQTMVEEDNEHQVDEDADSDAEEETETKVVTPDGCPKMALAKLVYEHPHLWYQKHRDFYNLVVRDATWDRIAKTLNKTREETKHAWKGLRNVYRLRVQRLKQGTLHPNARVLQEPLFKQLELMFAQNKTIGPSDPLVAAEAASQVDESDSGEEIGKSESPEETTTTTCRDNVGPLLTMADKVRLVEEVSKHEHIWKATHADYYNIGARDASWDLIAETLNKTREQAKHGWKCMRKVYRTRMQRLKQGLLSPDDRALKEPFFKQLELLFAQNTKNDPPVSSEASEPPPVDVAAASQMDASVSDEEHAGDTVESESDKNLKLVGLCEKYELIWNKKHPDNASVKKRMAAWDSIAQKMNLTRDQTRALWSRLFSLHRIRSSRIARGKMSKTSPVLRDPLYRKLEAMLKGQMQGEEGGEETGKIEPPEETMKPRRGKVGPFPRMEDKVRLVEEVFKHEHLWNATHIDYFKSEKRGATWTQIAAMFQNCDAWGARNEWRRLRNKHRPRKTCAVSASTHDNEEDEATVSNPLYELFSKMAESLIGEADGDPTENAESSAATPAGNDKKRWIQEVTETYMTHKRRYTGKRVFNNEGCIKFIKGGITRYAKICELCGKQIERSLFEYHMNQHNGLKPYACSVEGCGRKYGNKIRRDRHEVIDHCEDGYIFECDQCDEKFKYQSKFNYHYAIKHVSQQVPCTFCGKLFKHKRLITEHLRRGTGCKKNVLRASLAS